MKTTRNRKVKRGKTRRTCKKTRTVYRGGLKWWPWPFRDRRVVPEQSNNQQVENVSLTETQVEYFLTSNNYNKTLEVFSLERNKSNGKQIYVCFTPCNEQPQTKDVVQSSAQPSTVANVVSSITPNKENKTKNGWYIENGAPDRDIPNPLLLKNDNLKDEDDGVGYISNYSNHLYSSYVRVIHQLPNPLYTYSTSIDGKSHKFLLKSINHTRLAWVEDGNPQQKIGYDTTNSLTITYNGSIYQLTVEKGI